ncbi:MAG: hypothetical protein EXS01_05070 [Phycisphaerales bacterium]|nr:hypothetical protein [Phycisphaerales bacterium]
MKSVLIGLAAGAGGFCAAWSVWAVASSVTIQPQVKVEEPVAQAVVARVEVAPPPVELPQAAPPPAIPRTPSEPSSIVFDPDKFTRAAEAINRLERQVALRSAG